MNRKNASLIWRAKERNSGEDFQKEMKNENNTMSANTINEPMQTVQEKEREKKRKNKRKNKEKRGRKENTNE